MQIPKKILAVIAGGALSIGSTTPVFASHAAYSNGDSNGYSNGYRQGDKVGYDRGYDKGSSDGYDKGYDVGSSEGYDKGYGVGFDDGQTYEQELQAAKAAEGSAPALAGVPDLTAGMLAPKLDVGSEVVSKGTVSYSNSIGLADSFNVGAMTNIGATASATSTPDYNVTSNATFGIGNSTIDQVIGTKKDIPSALTPITGSFSKAYTPDSLDNNVKVKGIGTDSSILASSNSTFSSDIEKIKRIKIGGELVNSGAGSANGAAGGSVGTTTTASANSSQFVSSFAQAY